MLKADLPLRETAQHLVFGEGSCDPGVFFIGEAPGKNEDLQGLPFVGSAGKQLELLLNSIGLTRESVYITSILKYRPPKNRQPTIAEIHAHTPFLVDQIRIIKPSLIVPLGNFATRFILSGMTVEKMSLVSGITQIHGKLQEVRFEDLKFHVLPVFHPAAILYRRPLKKTLEEDFQKIKMALDKS
ncbi:MAG: uracil-DNA glycosylase [Candidatus Omnitrophica bacterium]|nr:uracil-DNA glycosylase [Candidatus Omnitrophota bacterium]